MASPIQSHEKLILFPMKPELLKEEDRQRPAYKRQPQEENLQPPSKSSVTDYSDDDTSTVLPAFDSGSIAFDATKEVTWVGMTTLTMIERIASAVVEGKKEESKRNLPKEGSGEFLISSPDCAKAKSARDDNEDSSSPSIVLDAAFFARPTAGLVAADIDAPQSPSSPKNLKVCGSGSMLSLSSSFSSPPRANAAADAGVSTPVASGQKRGRSMDESDTGDSKAPASPSRDDNSLAKSPVARLHPWDPSFIVALDPASRHAAETVAKLRKLAERFESSPAYDICSPSYRRLRDQLSVTISWIHRRSDHSDDPKEAAHRKRYMLDRLYIGAIVKMRALLDMASEQSRRDVIIGGSSHLKITAPSPEGRRRRGGNQSDSPLNASNSPRREYSKKDFAAYMVNWLRANWTNPYPDDDGLAQMANDCGTTTTVVSNWLINARTRKWRPSIIKACEMGRPADMLKEDAINIFDGKPLRQVEGMVIVKTAPISGKKGKKPAKTN